MTMAMTMTMTMTMTTTTTGPGQARPGQAKEKLQFTNEIFRIQSLNGSMRTFGFNKVQSYPEGTTCNLLTPKHSEGKRLKYRQT
ncbi:hypothetical protein M0804_007214 [Polistes exclamans]|nr:hypothetical protein M0804_007214 [Polistes exclamans]